MGLKLCGNICQRRISWITSEASCRFRKFTKLPGRVSLLLSWMKARVARKTPVDENKYPAVAMNQNQKLTNERHARRRDFGERRTTTIEIFVWFDDCLAGGKLSHVSLIHFLPWAPETPYRGRIQSRYYSNHARVIVHRKTSLRGSKHRGNGFRSELHTSAMLMNCSRIAARLLGFLWLRTESVTQWMIWYFMSIQWLLKGADHTWLLVWVTRAILSSWSVFRSRVSCKHSSGRIFW